MGALLSGIQAAIAASSGAAASASAATAASSSAAAAALTETAAATAASTAATAAGTTAGEIAATSAIPAAVTVTPEVSLTASQAAAVGAAKTATDASLYTKLATAAALGSAGAGIIQATKGAPDLPKPAPPPMTPTLADPRVQAAGMDARTRAAARGGMGFGNTITNTGRAQGLAPDAGLLSTRTLLG